MGGDDWHAESVQAGVNMAAKQLNRKVNGKDGFWRFE